MDPITLGVIIVGAFVLGCIFGVLFRAYAWETNYEERRRRWSDKKN